MLNLSAVKHLPVTRPFTQGRPHAQNIVLYNIDESYKRGLQMFEPWGEFVEDLFAVAGF